MNIDSHYGSAATLEGLAETINSMRWVDLEQFTTAICDMLHGRGDAKPDGSLFADWAAGHLEYIAQERAESRQDGE